MLPAIYNLTVSIYAFAIATFFVDLQNTTA